MGKCPNFLAISLQHSKVCSENCRVLAQRSLCLINTVETHTKRNRTTCNTCRERETNETLQRHLPSCQNAHLNFKLISHRHAWERKEKTNERKQICKLTAHIHTHTHSCTHIQTGVRHRLQGNKSSWSWALNKKWKMPMPAQGAA